MKRPADERGAGAYVQKVREDTHRYALEVLTENERLRVLVASLESERQRLEERACSDEVLREMDVLKGLVAALERDKLRLLEQYLAAHHELESHRRERPLLERRLAEIQKESRRFSEQYEQVETQNSNLANLYVASYRLHGTLERREVLDAIQEIVANLIGSEELAIYEMDSKGGALKLVASFGIDPMAHDTVPLGAGRIGRAAASGDPDVGPGLDAGERAAEAHLTACIPLKLDGKVTGVLALFRLLPQKAGFEAIDHELFELLATHAATALYCTGLRSRVDSQWAS